MARNPDYGFNHNNNHRSVALDDQYEICKDAAGSIAGSILDKARTTFLSSGAINAERLVYAICLNAYTAIQLRFVGEVLKDVLARDSTDDGSWALAIQQRVMYLATDAYRYDRASEDLAMYGEIQNNI